MKTKCPQMKCGYNIYGGCRACALCNAPPNIIDEDCDICHNCAWDDGFLRWDDNSPIEDEDITEQEEDKDKQEIMVKC